MFLNAASEPREAKWLVLNTGLTFQCSWEMYEIMCTSVSHPTNIPTLRSYVLPFDE